MNGRIDSLLSRVWVRLAAVMTIVQAVLNDRASLTATQVQQLAAFFGVSPGSI
jgi:plasmid maintenance system antidote protein VapI